MTPWDEIAIRMGSALVVGLLAGLDRELRSKPAGLKTFSLVALGSAVVGLVTLEMLAMVEVDEGVQMDPVRAVSGVMGGIGFLGAGTIIRANGDIEGVTTAACIWLVGALGLACGLGYYVLALCGLVGMMLVLLAVGLIEHRWVRPIAKDQDAVE